MRQRGLLSLVALLAAIPGASFTAYYGHVFPEPGWYYEFRSCPGTECLLMVLGIAGGLASSLLPRVLQSIPLIGVAVFAIAPIIKPLVAPLPEGMLHDEWSGTVCLQSTPSTCGAAAAATILQTFGLSVTEAQLAQEAYSSASGTEAWYLARAVRNHGFAVRFHLVSDLDPNAQYPAIVGVRLGEFGHFIAILSREGDRFHVGDPLVGPEVLSHAELLARYRFTGFFMCINPVADEGSIAGIER